MLQCEILLQRHSSILSLKLYERNSLMHIWGRSGKSCSKYVLKCSSTEKRERELKLARDGAALQSIPLLANAWTLHSTSVASRLLSNKKLHHVFKMNVFRCNVMQWNVNTFFMSAIEVKCTQVGAIYNASTVCIS